MRSAIFFLFTTIFLVDKTISLQFTAKPIASHYNSIEQSHDQAKNKEYKFLYTPHVDPKTYLGDLGPSPRIMKYLPLVNKDGEIQPYNNDIEKVKKMYLAKLKYDKVANKTKANQLFTFLGTEMGKSILTYFQDLARGGLNFYNMTEDHFKQWLALKIVAGKDIKMYARSMIEDTELFKQFYIKSRNRKIVQIQGIPEAPIQPMRYIPPVRKSVSPQSNFNNKIKELNPPKIKSNLNSTKSVNNGQTKTSINVKLQTSPNKTADKNNLNQFKNVKLTTKVSQQTSSSIKRQNQTKKNQIASNSNNNMTPVKNAITQQTLVSNQQNSKLPKLSNKQINLPIKNDKQNSKNTRSTQNLKNIKNQRASPLQTKGKIINTIGNINNNKVQMPKPKTEIKISVQTKIPNKVDNRQSIQTKKVKKQILTQKKQEQKAVQIVNIKPVQQTQVKSLLQIIPESKIQVQEAFYDRKFSQK